MRKVILHVGAGKCGSSALQHHLSRVPVLKTSSGETLKYGSLGIDGTITTGKQVKEKANSSIFQYSSSVLLSNTVEAGFTEKLGKSLEEINTDILVLSCEGWLGQHSLAADKLKCLSGYCVELLAYVRPPVEWLNSAWWQWGAWGNNVPFEKWFSRSISSTFWSEFIDGWNRTGIVSELSIRVMPKDVVADFYLTYSIPYSEHPGDQSNKSLPGSVLRLFQQHTDLRPSAHEPQIDFTISRRLSEITSRPDWVLSPDNIKDAILITKPFNQRILDMVCTNQRESIENNSAWWDESHFKHKENFDPMGRAISDEEKDIIMYHSVSSLHKAEAEIISLKNKLRRLVRQSAI